MSTEEEKKKARVAELVVLTDWPEYAVEDCIRLGFTDEQCVAMADEQKAAVAVREAADLAASERSAERKRGGE